MLVNRTGADQRSVEIHAHEPLVIVPVHGQQHVQLHPAEDGRVVDQEVDAAELGDRAVGHGSGGSRIGDVDRHGERPAAPAGDPGGNLLGAGGVDVGDHHRRTLLGERFGIGLTDAAAGAGDDRHLAVELSH